MMMAINRARRHNRKQQKALSRYFALAQDFKVTMTRASPGSWASGTRSALSAGSSAKAEGLLVNPQREREVLGRGGSHRYTAVPDPNAKAHESLNGPWHVAEMVPKRHFDWATGQWGRQANFGQRRSIPPGSLVHESPWERRDNYNARLPHDAILVSTLHSAP